MRWPISSWSPWSDTELVGVGQLKRLALQQPRHLARQACSLANEHLLQRRRAVDEAKPDVTHGAQQRRPVREQEVERVGGNAHRHGVEPPPALVALEHILLPEIDPEPRRVDHNFGQGRDVLQSHVESLARDRMDDMRGIADQRQPLRDEGARNEIGQWEGARLIQRPDLAEMQAETLLELAVKFLVAELYDPLGFRPLLGPY